MPVTQFFRCTTALLHGGNTGGDAEDVTSATGNTGGIVTLADSVAPSTLSTVLYAAATGDGESDDRARIVLPKARITGIEFRVGCILRGVGGGSLLDNNAQNDVRFYFSKYGGILDINTPDTSTYTPANDRFRLIATKNATDLANTYVGSGTTNDPRNYPTLLGGEGELFGLTNKTETDNFYNNGYWGLRIERGSGQSSYEAAVGGDTFDNDNPMPAVRYYYEYPKVYINTGKIKLTNGKINMGY